VLQFCCGRGLSLSAMAFCAFAYSFFVLLVLATHCRAGVRSYGKSPLGTTDAGPQGIPTASQFQRGQVFDFQIHGGSTVVTPDGFAYFFECVNSGGPAARIARYDFRTKEYIELPVPPSNGGPVANPGGWDLRRFCGNVKLLYSQREGGTLHLVGTAAWITLEQSYFIKNSTWSYGKACGSITSISGLTSVYSFSATVDDFRESIWMGMRYPFGYRINRFMYHDKNGVYTQGLPDYAIPFTLYDNTNRHFRNPDGTGIFVRGNFLYVPHLSPDGKQSVLVYDIAANTWLGPRMEDPYVYGSAFADKTWVLPWGHNRMLYVGRDAAGFRWSVWNLDTWQSVESSGIPMNNRGRPGGLGLPGGFSDLDGYLGEHDSVAIVDERHFSISYAGLDNTFINVCDINGCDDSVVRLWWVKSTAYDASKCVSSLECSGQRSAQYRVWREPGSGFPHGVRWEMDNSVNGLNVIPFELSFSYSEGYLGSGQRRWLRHPSSGLAWLDTALGDFTVVAGAGSAIGVDQDGFGSDAVTTAPFALAGQGDTLYFTSLLGYIGSVSLSTNYTRVRLVGNGTTCRGGCSPTAGDKCGGDFLDAANCRYETTSDSWLGTSTLCPSASYGIALGTTFIPHSPEECLAYCSSRNFGQTVKASSFNWLPLSCYCYFHTPADNPASWISGVGAQTQVVLSCPSPFSLPHTADGVGQQASLAGPHSIVVSEDNRVAIVSEHYGHTLRRVNLLDMSVVTLAGQPMTAGHSDGAGQTALLHTPLGLCWSPSQRAVFFTQANHVVRMATVDDGIVQTIAGLPNVPGQNVGDGTTASFTSPNGITLDEMTGKMYVNNYGFMATLYTTPAINHREIAVGRAVGDGVAVFGVDGPADAARCHTLRAAITVQPGVAVYFIEHAANNLWALRRLDLWRAFVSTIIRPPNNYIAPFIGTTGKPVEAAGQLWSANSLYKQGPQLVQKLFYHRSGTLFVSGGYGIASAKVHGTRRAPTVIQSQSPWIFGSDDGQNSPGSPTDGAGTQAGFVGVGHARGAFSSDGAYFYFADQESNPPVHWTVELEGVKAETVKHKVALPAGALGNGSDTMSLDGRFMLQVEAANHVISKWDAWGEVPTMVVVGVRGSSHQTAYGAGTAALLDTPKFLVWRVEPPGVSQHQVFYTTRATPGAANCEILQVTWPGAAVTRFAGGACVAADGSFASARLGISPADWGGLATDDARPLQLYHADATGSRIVLLDPTVDAIVTVLGDGDGRSRDGVNGGARLYKPRFPVIVAKHRVMFFADEEGARTLRKWDMVTGFTSHVAGSALSWFDVGHVGNDPIGGRDTRHEFHGLQLHPTGDYLLYFSFHTIGRFFLGESSQHRGQLECNHPMGYVVSNSYTTHVLKSCRTPTPIEVITVNAIVDAVVHFEDVDIHRVRFVGAIVNTTVRFVNVRFVGFVQRETAILTGAKFVQFEGSVVRSTIEFTDSTFQVGDDVSADAGATAAIFFGAFQGQPFSNLDTLSTLVAIEKLALHSLPSVIGSTLSLLRCTVNIRRNSGRAYFIKSASHHFVSSQISIRKSNVVLSSQESAALWIEGREHALNVNLIDSSLICTAVSLAAVLRVTPGINFFVFRSDLRGAAHEETSILWTGTTFPADKTWDGRIHIELSNVTSSAAGSKSALIALTANTSALPAGEITVLNSVLVAGGTAQSELWLDLSTPLRSLRMLGSRLELPGNGSVKNTGIVFAAGTGQQAIEVRDCVFDFLAAELYSTSQTSGTLLFLTASASSTSQSLSISVTRTTMRSFQQHPNNFRTAACSFLSIDDAMPNVFLDVDASNFDLLCGQARLLRVGANAHDNWTVSISNTNYTAISTGNSDSGMMLLLGSKTNWNMDIRNVSGHVRHSNTSSGAIAAIMQLWESPASHSENVSWAASDNHFVIDATFASVLHFRGASAATGGASSRTIQCTSRGNHYTVLGSGRVEVIAISFGTDRQLLSTAFAVESTGDSFVITATGAADAILLSSGGSDDSWADFSLRMTNTEITMSSPAAVVLINADGSFSNSHFTLSNATVTVAVASTMTFIAAVNASAPLQQVTVRCEDVLFTSSAATSTVIDFPSIARYGMFQNNHFWFNRVDWISPGSVTYLIRNFQRGDNLLFAWAHGRVVASGNTASLLDFANFNQAASTSTKIQFVHMELENKVTPNVFANGGSTANYPGVLLEFVETRFANFAAQTASTLASLTNLECHLKCSAWDGAVMATNANMQPLCQAGAPSSVTNTDCLLRTATATFWPEGRDFAVEVASGELNWAPSLSIVLSAFPVNDNGEYVEQPEAVFTIANPPGQNFTLSGATTQTTSVGTNVVTFSGIQLINPMPGTQLLDVTYQVRQLAPVTRQVEFTVVVGTGVRIAWVSPDKSITSRGKFLNPPKLRYYDVNGAIATVPNMTALWNLTTNHSGLNAAMSGNILIPISELAATFANLQFAISEGVFDGEFFSLSLVSVGEDRGLGSIIFPPPLVLRVASCLYAYKPTNPAYVALSAGRDGLPLGVFGDSTSGAFADFFIRGPGNFPRTMPLTGSCTWGGTAVSIVHYDVCNVACRLPGSAFGQSGALILSNDNVIFEAIGTVTVVGPPSYLRTRVVNTFSSNEQPDVISLARQPLTTVRMSMEIVDASQTPLGVLVPGGYSLWCNSTSYELTAKWVRTPYTSPYVPGSPTVTPIHSPQIVDGHAEVDFVFDTWTEQGKHEVCCRVPGYLENATCFDVSVEPDCAEPPRIVSVQTSGCVTQPSGALTDCNTQGLHPLTLIGTGFGSAGAVVRIAGEACGTVFHDATTPEMKVIAFGCSGLGSHQSLRLFRAGTPARYGEYPHAVTFAVPPIIHAIAGCDDYFPSTANCPRTGNATVTIHGENFGASGASVHFFYYFAPGPAPADRVTASSVVHMNSNGTKLVVTGFTAEGERFAVGVQLAAGELRVSSQVTLSFQPVVVIPCQGTPQCSGHGLCDTAVGVCTCYQDATLGFWVGDVCGSCNAGYFGSTCVAECPGGAATPCNGASQGTCDQGVTGSGVCTCNPGYGGTACQSICPGGLGNPCNGHGNCTQKVDPPTCACDADLHNGFYAGALCSSCHGMYVGSNCDQRCPTAAVTPSTPCSGQGTCVTTATGAACRCDATFCGSDCSLSGSDCGICPNGRFGTGCANFCPGYAAGPPVTVCSGHGTCGEGVPGSGLCICDAGYAGAACHISCPPGPCSGHGSCNPVTGTCTCAGGYATFDCSVACPALGTPDGICSGHGTCHEGRSGSGACSCLLGYTSANCSQACPGGIASPCSLHGTCNSNETCSCYSSPILGFWSGLECTSCDTDWYGPTCNGTCPKWNNTQCAGHGSCTIDLTCNCFDSTADGYWQAPLCEKCQANYWGSDCINQCPGGACNACSKNGICNDGVAGTGQCTCFANATAGYWAGSRCDECLSDYYGIACSLACPSTANGACNGKGTCDDGTKGNGTCICVRDGINGYWGGAACDECLNGFYGSDCKSPCPGSDGFGTACNGNGNCNDGFAGDGTCTCFTGFGLSDCSSGCVEGPPSVFCNNHGICLDGATRNGTCSCDSGPGTGYWSGASCDDCVPGFWGVSCLQPCPVGLGGLICSARGMCSDNTNGTGACACFTGFSGPGCASECNGGADRPCNNKGVCNQLVGTCTCFQDPVNGYWAGANCTECSSMYESDGCLTRCPSTGAMPNTPCSGRGSCYGGLCQCDETFCGDKCELEGEDCADQCREGYWGPDCDNLCPGNGECDLHGRCNSGKTGDGRCTCFIGYWGDDCAGECPGLVTDPITGQVTQVCGGNGNCISGECICNSGWATELCTLECPGGWSSPCNGHGNCGPADGVCTCDTDPPGQAKAAGWAGVACELECDGGTANPCSGHGVCDPLLGTCTCVNDATGKWDGTACDRCVPGYYGPNCLSLCVNGYTNLTTCWCHAGWSGADCTLPCPGVDSASGICNGRGTCRWGHQYSSAGCNCVVNYYSADCSIYCTPSKCSQSPDFLVNGECNPASGKCTCVDSDASGHWTDESTYCTTCKLFYWGPACKDECPCLKRGGCDKFTGECQCFDDDANGHYSGVACEKCKAGYVGVSCKGKDVAITKQKPCSALAAVRANSEFLLVDAQMDLVLSGGRPIIACNRTTRDLVGAFDINGTVIAGHVAPDKRTWIFTLTGVDSLLDPTQQIKVQYDRVPHPTFSAPTSTGSVYNTTAEDIAIATTGRSLQQLSTGRTLQATWTFQSPVQVAVIELRENEYLTVMSDGFLSVGNGTSVSAQGRVPDGYFTQIMHATVSTSRVISPQVLVLGGVTKDPNQFYFQLCTIPIPDTTTPLAAVATIATHNERIIEVSTLCKRDTNANLTACLAVSRIVCDGTYFVLAMSMGQGVSLLRFRYTQLYMPGVAVETNSIYDRYDPSHVFNVTAMVVEPIANAGFVAINYQSPNTTEPSTIFKFDLLDLSVYGSVVFLKILDSYEIVTSLVPDGESRMLFATVPLSTQINVVPLNLYAVTRVFPHIADTTGGTVITVEGEGFAADDYLMCDFNGTYVTATLLSSRKLLCVAPAGGDERCEGVPLEVTVRANQWTKNNVNLRRVATPVITKVYAEHFAAAGVDNGYGNLTGGSPVLLDGVGFQDSPFLTCRFASTGSTEVRLARTSDRNYVYSNGQHGIFYGEAVFVNSSHMRCHQPRFDQPTRGIATVEVTLDGNIYSTSRHRYEVVGQATGIASFREAVTEAGSASWALDLDRTFTSAARVNLSDINVFVVDTFGQRLRSLDTFRRTITVQLSSFIDSDTLRAGNSTARNWTSVCDYPKHSTEFPTLHTSTALNTVTRNGRATFTGLYLMRPPAGQYLLRLLDTTTQWSYDHIFTVRQGPAHRIRICKEPSQLIDNQLKILPTQPIVYVEDVSGNQLAGTSLAGISVSAAYITESTTTTAVNEADRLARRRTGVPVDVAYAMTPDERVAELKDDFLVFDGIEMFGLYGQLYYMNFTGEGLLPAQSHGMRVAPCKNNTQRILDGEAAVMMFTIPGTGECFECPEAGWCDGTPNVKVRYDNWWRPDEGSYLFYSCDKVHTASESCLAPNGTCEEGYKGARCSVCEDGWGLMQSKCHRCQAKPVVAMLIIGLMVITMAFVTVLVAASLTSKLSEALPVVLKITINHFQVSSRVNDIIVGLPPTLKTVFDIQLQLSELIRFDIVSSECEPLAMDIYTRFYFALTVPIIMIVIIAGGLGVLHVWRVKKGYQKQYEAVIPLHDPLCPVRRDRVMVIVNRFVTNLKMAAAKYHKDYARDDYRMHYYTIQQYFSAAAVIILLLVYPTILQWCTAMWNCDAIAFGHDRTFRVVEYLRVDRSVVCTDTSHRAIMFVALLAALFYGALVPILSTRLTLSHWTLHGRAHARRLYAYTLAGYSVRFWFWENVVLARKAAIVFIIIFISDNLLRTYLCMWVLTAGIGLHNFFQPFDTDRPSYYNLEGLGMVTVAVTLNLSLLFQFEWFAQGEIAYTVLLIFLVAVNAIALLVFALFIGRALFHKILLVRENCRPHTDEELEAAAPDSTTDRGVEFSAEEPTVFEDSAASPGTVEGGRSPTHGRGSRSPHSPKTKISSGDEPTEAVFEEDENPFLNIDIRQVPFKDGETPTQRHARVQAVMEEEERRQTLRKRQRQLQSDYSKMHDAMAAAKFLRNAEEAASKKFDGVEAMLAKHEEELFALMDRVARERGERGGLDQSEREALGLEGSRNVGAAEGGVAAALADERALAPDTMNIDDLDLAFGEFDDEGPDGSDEDDEGHFGN